MSFYPHQHKIPGSHHHKSPKIQNRTRYSFSQTKQKTSSIPGTHTLDFHEYDFHTSSLLKLCNSLPQREATIKFQRILDYFHKFELMDSIYYKRVKNYILKHIRKMNKRDLIFMIWIITYLHTNYILGKWPHTLNKFNVQFPHNYKSRNKYQHYC